MFRHFRKKSRGRLLKKRRVGRGRRLPKLITGAASAVVVTAVILVVATSNNTQAPQPIDPVIVSSASTGQTPSAASTSSGDSLGASVASTASWDAGSNGTSAGSATGSDPSAGASTPSSEGQTSTPETPHENSSSGSAVVSSGGSLEGLLLTVETDPAVDSASEAGADPAAPESSEVMASMPSAEPVATSGGEPSTSGSDLQSPDIPAPPAITSAFDSLDGGALTTIEEDWELTVTSPDPNLSSPQVGTVMTPFENADDFYLAFTVNHRLTPGYLPGGMELQLWYQGQQVGWIAAGENLMSSANEKVTWTQRLKIEGGHLRFEIQDGHSTTWGNFGQGNSMQLSIPTTLTDLNDYHPAVSIENSGVTFASNRIGSFALKAVRGYDANGELLVEDTDPVVIFAPSESPE